MELKQIRTFRQTLRRFERLVVTQFKGFGCCSGVSLAQCHALMEIDSRGSLSLLDLAQGLGLDKSTLSRTVDGLVNIGLVERRPHPNDRRSIQLFLTDQGQRTCDDINEKNDALFMRVINRLNPENRESVLLGFQALVECMAAETQGLGCLFPTLMERKK
jgi:DNA-binding MarR family transcriptional regulator